MMGMSDVSKDAKDPALDMFFPDGEDNDLHVSIKLQRITHNIRLTIQARRNAR